MKLNADIIFDNLSHSVMIEGYGPRKEELTLNRPELFTGVSCEFQSNKVYISHVNRLPPNPVFDEGVVVICVGGKAPAAYLTNQCVCISVVDGSDLFTISNLVHQIFNKYDDWEAELQNILETTASVDEIIEISFHIIENPMVVVDANLRYLSYSSIIDACDDLALYRPNESGSFNRHNLSESINYDWTGMSIIKPHLVTIKGNKYFSINLFAKNIYSGNLSIPFVLRQYRPSDNMLAQYLGKVIEKAFVKHSAISSSSINILSSILQDLLNGFPIDATKRFHLENGNFNGQYVCIQIKLGYRVHGKVPAGYFCNLIENHFAGCVAFEYESAIAAFINLNLAHCEEDRLVNEIKHLLTEMNLKAGVSYPFSNLSMARFHYRQACVAFEMGTSINPELIYYPFHDYVMFYLLSHCMGEFPLELLYTKGIVQLIDHDLASSVNYIQTLSTYLNNNMNVTKTAKKLYLHRSTLLERLARIEALLQADLNNPDQRLHLLILLKIIENNRVMASKYSSF